MASRRIRIQLGFTQGKGSQLERALEQAGVDPTDLATAHKLLTLGALAWTRGVTIADGRDGLFAILPGEAAIPAQIAPYIESGDAKGRANEIGAPRLAVAAPTNVQVGAVAASNDAANAEPTSARTPKGQSTPEQPAVEAATAPSKEVATTTPVSSSPGAGATVSTTKQSHGSPRANTPPSQKQQAKPQPSSTPEQGRRESAAGGDSIATAGSEASKTSAAEKEGGTATSAAPKEPAYERTAAGGNGAQTATPSATENEVVEKGASKAVDTALSDVATSSAATPNEEPAPGSPLFGGTVDDFDRLLPPLGF